MYTNTALIRLEMNNCLPLKSPSTKCKPYFPHPITRLIGSGKSITVRLYNTYYVPRTVRGGASRVNFHRATVVNTSAP